MKLLSKNDVKYALITGITAGLLATFILKFLEKSLPLGINSSWLILLIPIFWLIGVQFGYFLGKWLTFFDQFGKFVAIGFTNFAVDAGVLNLLIALSSIALGAWFVFFKILSFSIAVVHSYFWNHTWTFESAQNPKSEFGKFIGVMLLSLLVNVGTAYSVVHFIPHTSTPETWANIGAIIGSAVALIFSFIGFKVVVFKK